MSTAVIFDMDGTLFDTEAVFQKYWNAIAKERGIVLPDAFKYEICGTSGEGPSAAGGPDSPCGWRARWFSRSYSYR